MITVRFASGFSVQYNDANWVTYTANVARLHDRKDGNWIADVSLDGGVVIEARRPCSTYNASTTTDEKLLTLVMDRLRELPRYRVVELKRALGAFNARRKTWRAE